MVQGIWMADVCDGIEDLHVGVNEVLISRLIAVWECGLDEIHETTRSRYTADRNSMVQVQRDRQSRHPDDNG